jgi:hypothetical protein
LIAKFVSVVLVVLEVLRDIVESILIDHSLEYFGRLGKLQIELIVWLWGEKTKSILICKEHE